MSSQEQEKIEALAATNRALVDSNNRLMSANKRLTTLLHAQAENSLMLELENKRLLKERKSAGRKR